MSRLGLSNRELRRYRDEVLPYAQRSGDRAYRFVLNRRGEKIEVRVWPNGEAQYRRVHDNGRPLDDVPARKDWHRATWPSPTRIVATAAAGVTSVVGLVTAVIEVF